MELPNLRISDIIEAIPDVESLEPITEGGQKQVYRARIRGQFCALKLMLLPKHGFDRGDPRTAEIILRARREYDTMCRCDSPNLTRPGPLAPTIASISDQQVLYFTEAWIDGTDVATLLSQTGPLPVSSVIQLGIDISRAIECLWNLQRVHRDIKPANIMKRPDELSFVLVDLGYTLDLMDVTLTHPGWVPGTLPYLSPEQSSYHNRRCLDCRSDLFSLGVVLYETVTGIHPFWVRGMPQHEVVEHIRNTTPSPPSAIRPGIPESLDRVILRLLEKKPHLRFRRCSDVIEALSAI